MELLERYQPLFVIGTGGMGTIEVAVERGSLDARDARIVALKRMLPGVRDRRHVDMFMREARLATLLNHENVVHAFAFGEHGGELLFAMEYVEGETLANFQTALADRGARLPVNVGLYLLAKICEGLHAAHELRDVTGAPLGVVHRDVSPHNVMLSYRGDIKLLDFGVAKLGSAQHLTKTGEVKGKTAYMSPEQAMGETLDRRSDLYSVGAILFELVVGRRMWSGETDLELLRQLALADPPKLEDAAPDAPPELADLHARLVAKKAKDRPETAGEVADSLEAILAKMGGAEVAASALVSVLDETYREEAKTKRQRLEAALAHRDDDPRSGEPGAVITPASTRRSSRAAPWLYAFVGAGVASVAVLGIARTRPQSTPMTSPSVSAVASSPVASSAVARVVPSLGESVATPVRAAPSSTAVRSQRAQPVRAPSATAAASAPPTTQRPPIDVDPHPI